MAKEKKEQQKRKRIECNKCKSSFGYLRIKKGEWVCRTCGNVQKIKRGVKDSGGN